MSVWTIIRRHVEDDIAHCRGKVFEAIREQQQKLEVGRCLVEIDPGTIDQILLRPVKGRGRAAGPNSGLSTLRPDCPVKVWTARRAASRKIGSRADDANQQQAAPATVRRTGQAMCPERHSYRLPLFCSAPAGEVVKTLDLREE